MEEKMLETNVVEMDKFYPNTAEAGEELTIYRRLADNYDLTAVAMRNAQSEFIGYLDREVAENIVLPAIQNGNKFQCIVVGEGEEPNTLSVRLREYDPELEMQVSEESEGSADALLDASEVSDEEVFSDDVSDEEELSDDVSDEEVFSDDVSDEEK